MSDNGYTSDKFYTSGSGQGGITVSLLPNNAVYDEFAPEEVFMTNGVWFRWNLGEVEAGNYYLRMVCSNGQMEAVERKIAHTNRLDEASVRQMLLLSQDETFIGANLKRMRQNALLAMRTDASVGEVRIANRLLARYGADDATVEEIAPYVRLTNMYAVAGYDMKHFQIAQARSDVNMWDLFNRITAFATHNKEWSAEDNRRSGPVAQPSARHQEICKYFLGLRRLSDFQRKQPIPRAALHYHAELLENSDGGTHHAYGMEYPNYKFYDTLQASRRIFGNSLPNHRLQTTASAYGYDLTAHHHDLADAEAVAAITLRIL